jgi:subtilase-type serine protease
VTVTVANGLTINGGAFNVFEPGGVSPLLTNGTYTLLDYDVSFTGVITDLSVANSQIGKFYTITNDTTNTLITLTVIDTTISEWNGGAADGLWTSGGNWSLGVPNATGAVAKFGTLPAIPTSVAVNGAKTLGGILFDNVNSYTITGGAAEPITLNNGFAAATMTVTNGNHTITAPIILATSANATTAPGTALNLEGNISGAKTFIAAGAGITVLTGTNSYAATNINGGTLQIGNNSPTGTLGTDDVTIAPGATLAFYRSNDLTVSNNIFGADATVTKLGAGTLTLTGSNTFATTALGGFNINEGTVKLSSAGALPSGVKAQLWRRHAGSQRKKRDGGRAERDHWKHY